MNIVFQILIAVLIFGLLIFIHELGHFTVGKLSGMQINEFAIGMGPKIFSWKRGETQYALRLLPVGGYVAVEGEDQKSENPRALNNVALWKRICFVSAGAFMNLVLGFVILAILVGMMKTLPTTTVSVFEEGSSSSSVLQTGDKILKVNGSQVFTTNDISFCMVTDKDGQMDFTVLRDGKKQTLTADFHMQTLEDGTRIIHPDFFVEPKPNSFWDGLQYTVLWMCSIVKQVWLSFLSLITGNFKFSELAGPVGVSAAIGKASTAGLESLLSLVGFITVNIGVFNLLPIPALDGGRLLFLFIELVIRRPVNPKYEGAIHAAGFILLMGLMLVVSLGDIWRLIQA